MFLYVIGSNDIQKIGYSKDVSSRLRRLQTGNPVDLVLHHVVEVPEDRARIIEQHLHKELSYLRVRGEWFKMTPEQAKLQVEHAVIRWVDDVTI